MPRLVTTLWLLAWLGWMAWIFALSAQEHPPTPRAGFSFEDKIGHGFTYALMALLTLGLAVRIGRGRLGAISLYTVAWAWAALYGLSDEWHQGFVDGRDADALDLLADAAGAALLVGAVAVVRRRAL